VRYDDYSDFGDTVNPRVALVWTTTTKLTTKLLYGSAFRAPSYSELGYRFNPVSVGNPKLKPEHIDTVELSFSYRVSNDLQTSLTLFDYHAKDMIEFVRDLDATTSTAQNARDQDGQGFELETNWEPNPLWRLSGSYSYQDAKDSKTHAAVPDAPGQQIKLNASWEFKPNWLLTSQLNWVGDRQRAATDPRPAIADYTLIHMTLRRNDVITNLDMTLALRNITDEDAREPSNGSIPDDYPMASRSGWLEVKYRFQ
jgi:iron complex outermembrane receptor protein